MLGNIVVLLFIFIYLIVGISVVFVTVQLSILVILILFSFIFFVWSVICNIIFVFLVGKVFVVGFGYALVLVELIKKIISGVFVELVDFLVENLGVQELEFYIYLDGKLGCLFGAGVGGGNYRYFNLGLGFYYLCLNFL